MESLLQKIFDNHAIIPYLLEVFFIFMVTYAKIGGQEGFEIYVQF